MSRVISIFVATSLTLPQLASAVQPVLDAHLEELIDQEGNLYFVARNADSITTVNSHTLENDGDVRFEDYNLEIEFRAIKDQFSPVREYRTWAYAGLIFGELKQVLPYDMMLVDNIQTKLAEHHALSASLAQ